MGRSLIVVLAVPDHCGETFTDQSLSNVSMERAKQNQNVGVKFMILFRKGTLNE